MAEDKLGNMGVGGGLRIREYIFHSSDLYPWEVVEGGSIEEFDRRRSSGERFYFREGDRVAHRGNLGLCMRVKGVVWVEAGGKRRIRGIECYWWE